MEPRALCFRLQGDPALSGGFYAGSRYLVETEPLSIADALAETGACSLARNEETSFQQEKIERVSSAVFPDDTKKGSQAK